MPTKFSELNPTAAMVDDLKAFPFLDDATVLTTLKSELPDYLSKVVGIDPETDPFEWWTNHHSDLPPLVCSC